MTTQALAGTVSLVTGALGGIGSAVCRALADAGSTVVATDLACHAGEGSGLSDYRRLDVADENDWRRIVGEVEARYGRLDNLVTCAAVEAVGLISHQTAEDYRRCMRINVDGTFFGVQSAQDLLARSGVNRKGGSSIVALSSVGGIRGGVMQAAYCASKGAVRLFCKSAAIEFGMLGLPIRINSVHPGVIATGMIDRIFATLVDAGMFPDVQTAHGEYVKRHPIGRFGTPEEVAEGIVYLCTEGASFVTGSEFVIDGGVTA